MTHRAALSCADKWNSEIVDELTPQADDIVLYKTRFSGFYKTDLDERLRELGVKHLIITGCTTSICVESTVFATPCSEIICASFSQTA
jgi:nicotinamidase-related amidase